MNLRLIVLCILILLLLIYNFNYRIENFIINNNKEWDHYRLGDIIKGPHLFQKDEYYKHIPKLYPNSIGTEYIKQNKNKNKNTDNIDILNNIIKKKNIEYDIKELDFALHLRLGDSLKGYDKKTGTFTYNGNYPTKLETIDKNIDIFKNNKVHIFYGNHASWAKLNFSEIYLKKLRKLFDKHNIKYIEVNSGNPDLDFLNMCNAKIFVKSGGGYSNLITNIRNKNKKKEVLLN